MKWDGKIGLTLATVVALFSTTGAPSAEAQAKKPNIVFILVDNVGWGTFGVYGGTTPTPRIDQLANSGIRFNNYNVEVQRLLLFGSIQQTIDASPPNCVFCQWTPGPDLIQELWTLVARCRGRRLW